MSAAPLAPKPSRSPVPCRATGVACRLIPVSLVALGASLSAACSISPQPVPPPEETPTISIETSLISVFDDGNGGVTLHGDPGAVVPGADVLRALNRNSPSPAIDTPVLPDGSFDAILFGASTDAFRAQARKGAVYSAPVDVQGSGGGPVVALDPPFGGCVAVDPAREVAFEPILVDEVAMQPVRVVNNCPFDLSVASFATLSGNPAFETLLGTVSTGYIPMGSEALLGVAFHAVQPGLYEDEAALQFMSQPPDPPPDPGLLPQWLLTIRGQATSE